MNKTFNLIKQFLLLNGYNDLVFDDLQLQFLSHSDFPSFRSISDTFDYFGIENLAVSVPETALKQLPDIFLTLVIYNRKEELVYVTKIKDQLKLTGSNFDVTFSELKFLEIWSRNVIVVEKLNTIKKPKFRPYLIASALTVFVILCVLQSYYFTAMSGVYMLLLGMGLLVSFLLLRQQTGANDAFVQKVCSGISTNGGCRNVITSDSSKLFGIFSLLEASFAFFSAQFLTLFLIGYNPSVLAVLTLLSVPVLVYSIYSQAIVLKDWCMLCLIIAATTLLQLVVLVLDHNMVFSHFLYVYAIKLLAIFALLYFVATVMLKDRKQLANALNSEIKFLKFKRNASIFKSLLTSSAPRIYGEDVHKVSQIIFGNPYAKLSLTAVTNPFCGFCAKSFKAYYKLLKKYPEDINVNIIFYVPFKDNTHPSVKIIDAVIAAFLANDKVSALEMLYEWYTNKDMEAWEEKYRKNENIAMGTGQMLYEHSLVCDNMQISYTPATLVNGYLFPEGYEIDDIDLVMPNLIAESVELFQIAEELTP